MKFTRLQIKDMIRHNILLMRRNTFFLILFTICLIFTSQVEKIAGLNPREMEFYEKYVVMLVAVTYPLYTMKMLRVNRETKFLKERLNDSESEDDEISI